MQRNTINLLQKELDGIQMVNCYTVIEPILNDTITYGSLKLILTNDPSNYASYIPARGIVKKLPAQIKTHREGNQHYQPFDTEITIKEGDEVFFDRGVAGNILGEVSNTTEQLIMVDEKPYMKMHYSFIIAVKRGDNIFGINNYILIEPIKHRDSKVVSELHYNHVEKKFEDFYYTNDGIIRYSTLIKDEEFNIGDAVLLQSFKNKYWGGFLEPEGHRTLPYDLWYIQKDNILGTIL